MSKNSKLLATTAAIAISATAAFAQSATDQIVWQLQEQGFTRIEVDEGPTQIKVEAIRGSTKVEYVYDANTGALLSSESGSVDPGEDTSPGVEIESSSQDFEDDDDEEDDEEDDDEEDDDEDHESDDEEDSEDDDEDEDDEEDDDEDDDEEDDED